MEIFFSYNICEYNLNTSIVLMKPCRPKINLKISLTKALMNDFCISQSFMDWKVWGLPPKVYICISCIFFLLWALLGCP